MLSSEFREERASSTNSTMLSSGEKPEIAFFDVETTIPTRTGQGYAILEFGALLVCSQKLIELENYSTLVRPKDLNLISGLSVRCNGITKDDVVSAPSFAEIADKVYELLHGRIWAGHNILRFDCPRIKEAFAEIHRPPPVPKATIDSLELLTQRFGRRAGNMKMATLATYFGLGQQTHRSLDDVRMNLEVLKYCATVLLLESSLPDIFAAENSWVSPSATRRSHNKGQASQEGTGLIADRSSSSGGVENSVTQSHVNQLSGEIHSNLPYCSANQGLPGLVGCSNATANSFDMGQLRQEVERDCLPSDDSLPSDDTDSLPSDDSMEEEEEEKKEEEEEELEVTGPTSRESSSATGPHGLIKCDFLEPDEISMPSISVILAPFYRGTQKVQILHKGISLEICCRQLKVRFGVSTKFVDAAGRPRLSFVADASPSLCEILDISDALAGKLSTDSGSTSEWRPVVTRKAGFVNSPTIRLHLLTWADGNMVRWITEIYCKDSSATQRLDFSNPIEVESLLTPGGFIDAYFSLDTYDYQQSAGIRLVAKKSGTERSKLKILLCDPNTDSCRDVLSVLCELSYKVIAVCSDAQIFDALNSEGPQLDIILACVDLLLVNGAEILRYIMHHKELQHVPVIMLSTKDQSSVIINGLRLGAADYLVKPFQAEELANLWMHINTRKNEAVEGCCSRFERIDI